MCWNDVCWNEYTRSAQGHTRGAPLSLNIKIPTRVLTRLCLCIRVCICLPAHHIPACSVDACESWCISARQGAGLSERQRSMCDKLVFIPQNRGGASGAGGGSSSLNVACAAAIVLQV